jgi:hypothetical protein
MEGGMMSEIDSIPGYQAIAMQYPRKSGPHFYSIESEFQASGGGMLDIENGKKVCRYQPLRNENSQ